MPLLSLPGQMYANCLKKNCREIAESNLEDGQCGFRSGRSTTDQIFTLRQPLRNLGIIYKEKAVFACFVDSKKAYDRFSPNQL